MNSIFTFLAELSIICALLLALELAYRTIRRASS